MTELSERERCALGNLLNDERIVRLSEALDASRLYLVGGATRTVLLCQESDPMSPLREFDLDFCYPDAPEAILKSLKSCGISAIQTNTKHLTITAIPVSTLDPVEITSFRLPTELGKCDLSVGPDIATDLLYRDFTINALALNCSSGELLDPTCGLEDLRLRKLKGVGNPAERFGEDPLRMMRLARFVSELDFSIDERTLQAAQELASQISSVSIERIRDELSLIMLSPHPSKGLRFLHEINLLNIILPEIAAFIGFEQNKFHKADLFNHTMEVVDRTNPDLVLRLAALFHDVAKPCSLSVDESGMRHFYSHERIGAEMTTEILLNLRYPKQTVRDVQSLVRLHMRPIEAGPGGLRRLLRDTGDLFHSWRALKEADSLACKTGQTEVAEQLRKFDQTIAEIAAQPTVSPLASLAIKGNDILDLGISSGPIVGKILRSLHELVLDDPEMNDRELLLDMAKNMLDKAN